MKSLNLKITTRGSLILARPEIAPGPDNLVYQITGIPNEIQATAVIIAVSRVVLAHPHEGVDNWIYEWTEILSAQKTRLINRYKQAA